MKKIRNLVFVLLLTFSVSACGFLSSSTVVDPVLEVDTSLISAAKIFSVDEFDIYYPGSWRVLTGQDFPSDVPKETKVVFQSNMAGEFIPNVNISRVNLAAPVSAMDYSKQLLQQHRNSLLNFAELKTEDVEIPVAGEFVPTMLLTFSGKVSASAVERKFIQMNLTKDNFAYIVTAAVRVTEDASLVQSLEAVIKSFRLK
jgi:hypothetical protein